MNDNPVLNDAEEYDLESLENILLDWPMRCRSKLDRQSKGGSGRRQRVNRTCCTKRVKKDETREVRKSKLEPSKISKSLLLHTSTELLPVLPMRTGRSSRQNTHLQTVSILETLVELAQTPKNHHPTTNHSKSKVLTPSSSSKRDRMVCEPRVPVARGQTPDWIKDVFELVKKGETEKLLLTLKNMDAILIRNLSDQHGNNLFHVCAWNGQVECVKVLLEQGQECKEALYDENKQGFTPIVLSIKRGHLEFLKFLIECSDMRDRLLSDNSRPLIHWAAKYGQDAILKWLIIYMHNHEINLNVSDGDGNTALHVASKFGHISCIKVLVENEVDLTAQNHLGHKPADAARAFSHTACFEYLTALETSLLLAYEVSSLEEELHNVRMETFELKKHYKDVLSCARKSLKEKEELGTELKLLRTHINQFNEYLVSEVQVLKQDSTFDDKEKSTSRNEDKQNLLENLIEQYDNIQCQLQESYNRCCSKSALAEREAKILAADEKWRKIKSRMGHSVNPCRKPIAILNEILGQVYCRSSNVRFEELGHLSTSESSLTSLGSASVICEKLVPHKPMVDKTPTKTKVCHFQKRRGEQTGELKRVSSVPSIPGPAMPSSRESPFLVKLLGELTVNNLGPPLSTFSDPDDVTCTVLEVIDSLNSGNQLPVKSESSTKSEKPAKDDKQDEIDSNICTNRLECSVMSKASDSPSLKNCDTFNEELPPSPITEPQHTLLSSQPDLIKETKDVRAWESSSKNPGTNRTGICDWISEDYKADLLRNEVPPVPHPRINRSSDGFPYAPKRRGFLHKFAIRWPSKRKDIKPHNDHNEITPEDFKETYLARNDNDKRTSADTISIATTKDGSVKSSNKDYTESERDKVYEMVKADNTKTDSQTNERMQKYDGSTSGGETSIITLSDLAESQSCSAIFQLPLASKNLNTPNNANHTSTSSSKAKNITRLDFAALRAGGFPLWKTVTGSVDLLPDSSTVSRMSPAPSEVSKTESALFPPPSDLSHTESIRHSHQLGKIEEVGSRDAIKIALKVRQKQETLVSTKEEVVQPAGTQPNVNGIKKKNIEAKPWYDLSDDEDMLTPERLQKKGLKLRSSSEEEEQTAVKSM